VVSAICYKHECFLVDEILVSHFSLILTSPKAGLFLCSSQTNSKICLYILKLLSELCCRPDQKNELNLFDEGYEMRENAVSYHISVEPIEINKRVHASERKTVKKKKISENQNFPVPWPDISCPVGGSNSIGCCIVYGTWSSNYCIFYSIVSRIFWKTPKSQIFREYEISSHPICQISYFVVIFNFLWALWKYSGHLRRCDSVST